MKKYLPPAFIALILFIILYLGFNRDFFMELSIEKSRDKSIPTNTLQIVYSNTQYNGNPNIYILRDNETTIEYILIKHDNNIAIAERRKP